MQDSFTRPLWPALRRGLGGKCPRCGHTALFARFLKPVASCAGCGEQWADRHADDFPAYLVILLLGHLLVPLVVEANLLWSIPTAIQMVGWPLLAGALALAMIQPAKGFVLALLWAR